MLAANIQLTKFRHLDAVLSQNSIISMSVLLPCSCHFFSRRWPGSQEARQSARNVAGNTVGSLHPALPCSHGILLILAPALFLLLLKVLVPLLLLLLGTGLFLASYSRMELEEEEETAF